MNGRAIIFALALVWAAWPASAHRLDELLEATTVRLELRTVGIDVRLTPGVAVAGPMWLAADADGDGAVSDGEWRSFADRVGRDLSVSFDGRAVALRLASADYPSADAMGAGSGTVVLRFTADLPADAGPVRTLGFVNHYAPPAVPAVYLVNCLVPRDPGLHVTGQDRSYDQSTYRVTYTQAGAAQSPVAADLHQATRRTRTGALLSIATAALAAAALWASRRGRSRRG